MLMRKETRTKQLLGKANSDVIDLFARLLHEEAIAQTKLKRYILRAGLSRDFPLTAVNELVALVKSALVAVP